MPPEKNNLSTQSIYVSNSVHFLNTRSKSYVLDGLPTHWLRPTPRKGGGAPIDVQKEIKFAHGIMIKRQHQGEPLFKGILGLEIICYFNPPHSEPKKNLPLIGTYVGSAPDWDNLGKYIGDMCKGILYKDDRRIGYGIVHKIYDYTERTEFIIRELY